MKCVLGNIAEKKVHLQVPNATFPITELHAELKWETKLVTGHIYRERVWRVICVPEFGSMAASWSRWVMSLPRCPGSAERCKAIVNSWMLEANDAGVCSWTDKKTRKQGLKSCCSLYCQTWDYKSALPISMLRVCGGHAEVVWCEGNLTTRNRDRGKTQQRVCLKLVTGNGFSPYTFGVC